MEITNLLTLFSTYSLAAELSDTTAGKEDVSEDVSEDPCFYKEVLEHLPAFVHILHVKTEEIIWRNAEWSKLIPSHKDLNQKELAQYLESCIHPDDFDLLAKSTQFFQCQKKNLFGGIIRVKFFEEKDWKWLIGLSRTIKRDTDNTPLYNLAIFMDFTKVTQSNDQLTQALREVLSKSHQKTLKILTKREKEILQLLVKGHKNRQIAEELFISRHTVETHRKNLRLKLDVKNTPELISLAKDLGM